MTQSPARDAVEVTQADREAAKTLLGRDDSGPSWWSIDSGNADSDMLVQAFARHRLAASSQDHARGVEDAGSEVNRLRTALRKIVTVRPTGDINFAKNLGPMIMQIERIALDALTGKEPKEGG